MKMRLIQYTKKKPNPIAIGKFFRKEIILLYAEKNVNGVCGLSGDCDPSRWHVFIILRL